MSRESRLLDTGLVLASDLPLPEVLRKIVDLAADLTDAEYAALGVVDVGGRINEFLTRGVSERRRRQIGPPPTGGGLLGVLLQEVRPLRLRRMSEHPRSVGFPAHHPRMTSFLGISVRAMGRVYGSIYLADKRGADGFTAEDEATLVVLAAQAGIAVANAHLFRETRRHEAWLAAVSRVRAAALAGTGPAAGLAEVAAAARALAEADLALIIAPRRDGGRLAVLAADGPLAGGLSGLPAVEGALTTAVIAAAEACTIADLSRSRPVRSGLARLPRRAAAVVAPLRTEGRATGALWVMRERRLTVFDDATRGLVASFADHASAALDQARARSDRERLAVLEERERIARELHDGAVQTIFGVGMQLQAAALRAGDAELEGRLEGAANRLDGVVADLLEHVYDLGPGGIAGLTGLGRSPDRT